MIKNNKCHIIFYTNNKFIILIVLFMTYRNAIFKKWRLHYTIDCHTFDMSLRILTRGNWFTRCNDYQARCQESETRSFFKSQRTPLFFLSNIQTRLFATEATQSNSFFEIRMKQVFGAVTGKQRILAKCRHKSKLS